MPVQGFSETQSRRRVAEVKAAVAAAAAGHRLDNSTADGGGSGGRIEFNQRVTQNVYVPMLHFL